MAISRAARISIMAALLIAVAIGCGKQDTPKIFIPVSEDFELLSIIMASMPKDRLPVLYEGLPHPVMQPKWFAEEKRTQATIELCGYLFYPTLLPLKVEDAESLSQSIADKKSFSAFKGEKKCGGYHPDYVLEWEDDKTTFRAMICFGCGEIIVSNGKQSLRCDIVDERREKLKSILLAYHKHGPFNGPGPSE